MSTTVTYKNLAFQRSSGYAYICSIFGNKNYKATVFYGVKAVLAAWGWQFKQFNHTDSTFDTVYFRRRIRVTNTRTGAAFITGNSLYNDYVATLNPVAQPNEYQPSKAAWDVDGNFGTFVGFGTPTSPTSRPALMTGGSGGPFVAVQELLEPISIASTFAQMRAQMEVPPDPDYEEQDGIVLRGDSWGKNVSNGLWVYSTLSAPGQNTNNPTLAGYSTAQLLTQPGGGSPFSYYGLTLAKASILILNTRRNSITIEKYCSSQWTRTTDIANHVTFSPHRNCQTFANTPGPRPFVISIPLPTDDPTVTTQFLKNNEMVANQFYFPGYQAEGYPFLTPFGQLPPPGPCCVLT